MRLLFIIKISQFNIAAVVNVCMSPRWKKNCSVNSTWQIVNGHSKLKTCSADVCCKANFPICQIAFNFSIRPPELERFLCLNGASLIDRSLFAQKTMIIKTGTEKIKEESDRIHHSSLKRKDNPWLTSTCFISQAVIHFQHRQFDSLQFFLAQFYKTTCFK